MNDRGKPPVPVSVDRTGYRIHGTKYPRVTSILNCMAKPALIAWSAKATAEFAVNHKASWLGLPDADAIKLLKGSPWSQRDAAADRGSLIHSVIEAYLKGEPLPDMNEDQLDVAIAAERFLRDYQPEPFGIEVTVYDPTLMYAGTCDLPAKARGDFWLFDWKSGSGVYPEAALQLYAYSVAERAIIGDLDVRSPWLESSPRLGVVHLTPTGYTLHEVIAPRALLNDSWRALLDVYHWMNCADSALEVAVPSLLESA